MTGVEPNSIAEVVGILQLWAVKPGRGLALVEYYSEHVRRQVLQQLTQTPQFEFEELSFHSSGEIERDVREMVERVGKSEKKVVSIRGLEDAFPMGEERERAIDMLNFLRDTLAANKRRQLWWLTHDGMRLLRQRARDLYSWFQPRLELTETSKAFRADPEIENPISLDSAHAHLADSIARIRNSMEAGEDSVDLWASLAYPALRDLRRADAADEADHAREIFLDMIYGSAHDTARLRRMSEDRDVLRRRHSFDAAVGLSGPESDFDPHSATLLQEIERRMEYARASLTASRFKEATFHFNYAMEESERSFGADHPLTLKAINGLAVTNYYMGKYVESEKLHLRVLAGEERVLGKEHPDTLITVENLAELFAIHGRLEEAKRFHLRLLSARESSKKGGYPKIRKSLNALANICRSQGRPLEAEQFEEHAQAVREKWLH